MVLRKGFVGEIVKPKKVTGSGTSVKKIVVPSAESWLRLAMDKKYTDLRPMWSEPRQGGWRPSGMGEPCDRKTILGMMGYRGDLISTKLKRIFDMGNDIEARWRRRFQELGILENANQKIFMEGPPPVSGEYDVVVRHPYERTRRLLGEIKSINLNGFKKLPPPTADPEINFAGLMEISGDVGARIRKYMMQFQTYLYMTKIPEGFLLFDCKNDSEFADYILDPKPEMVERELARLHRLDAYRPRLIVPPCTCVGSKSGLCIYHPTEEVDLETLKIQTMTAQEV